MNNSHIPKPDPLLVPIQPEPRQSWKPWLWLAGCLLSFLAGRFLLPASHHAEERLSIAKSNHHHTPGDAIVVTTEPVTTRTLDRTVEAVGTLYGFEEVEISSKLDGTVAKIHYDLSSVVKPGDVLLELDSTDASLALDQAQRSLQAELSKWGFASVPDESYDRNQLPMVVSAKLRLDLARSRLERMLPLELTRSISADDLEQAKSETRIAESEWKNQLLLANSAAANARLKAADLAIAMQRLKDCQICVPNPTLTESDMPALYTVSERMVSEGTHVRPSSVVFRIVLGRTLKLRLSIPEVHASSLAIDQRVQITTSASSEFQWGRVAKISPAIDRATRTFIVEVEVPNEDGKSKPGSFAKAKILIGRSDNAITIPLAGLYSSAGINKIFLADADSAREIRVTLGDQSGEWIEIASPALPANSRVVTTGQRLLADGTRISERNPTVGSANTAPTNAAPNNAASTNTETKDHAALP